MAKTIASLKAVEDEQEPLAMPSIQTRQKKEGKKLFSVAFCKVYKRRKYRNFEAPTTC